MFVHIYIYIYIYILNEDAIKYNFDIIKKKILINRGGGGEFEKPGRPLPTPSNGLRRN